MYHEKASHQHGFEKLPSNQIHNLIEGTKDATIRVQPKLIRLRTFIQRSVSRETNLEFGNLILQLPLFSLFVLDALLQIGNLRVVIIRSVHLGPREFYLAL